MRYTSKYTPEQWVTIIAQAETSGLRRKDYLEINGITKDQFYYWKSRLPKLMDKVTPIAAPSKDTSLVEIPIVKQVSKTAKITDCTAAIVHIGNISIEINNSASSQFMENLGRMIHNAL